VCNVATHLVWEVFGVWAGKPDAHLGRGPRYLVLEGGEGALSGGRVTPGKSNQIKSNTRRSTNRAPPVLVRYMVVKPLARLVGLEGG
jgi:hypothetical protein